MATPAPTETKKDAVQTEAAPAGEAKKPTGVAAPSSDSPNGPFPSELAGWNWGAFFMTWIWGLAHRVWLSLLVFVPYVGLVMAIVLGMKGSEWAWKARKFESVEQFKAVQKAWAMWGLVLFIVSLIAFIAFFSFVSALVGSAILGGVNENQMNSSTSTEILDY